MSPEEDDNEAAARPAYRPPVDIDWKVIDRALEAGCIGTEIAHHIGVCPDTLYRRTEKEKGMTFSAYAQQKKQSGDVLLRRAQFEKAIGLTDLGDNTMLVWLGKTRLDQKESSEVSVSPETLKNFSSVMNQLDELQKSRQNESSTTKVEEETNGTRD